GSEWMVSPRQICPPSAGLSSAIATRLPDWAAETAAAMPAGPPPTTNTSNCGLELSIRLDVHSRHAQNLTTPTVQDPIDLSTTFKTNSHSAQRATRFAPHGSTAACPSPHHGRGDTGSGCNHDERSIHRNRNLLRHGRAPCFRCGKAGTAPWR